MSAFARQWDIAAKDAHATARAKGFLDRDLSDCDFIALVHCELSECVEALRDGNPPSKRITGLLATEEELADTVIRIMVYGWHRNWRIGDAIEEKMTVNRKRERLHGRLF